MSLSDRQLDASNYKPMGCLPERNFYFGLAIASCVTAGGFAAGALSGGELNPAVSTGFRVLQGALQGFRRAVVSLPRFCRVLCDLPRDSGSGLTFLQCLQYDLRNIYR